ncbi:hypothetical protein DSM3645_03418 [Blastopirellula marina DSM 3645]|uniref:Uncharacterized protein n=1 Tax=Blastopirellula marina DSM 3645 TaxID=314230 RepID=A3ZVZ7_9BACT|nr:hypothetical protein DSM3645_03418 [Blastopirellula marina DSM 3645]
MVLRRFAPYPACRSCRVSNQ